VALSGEVCRRFAQAEDIFRALLSHRGCRRFRRAVGPIRAHAEYRVDEAIEPHERRRGGVTCAACSLLPPARRAAPAGPWC
jgi:hypothetical protein